MGGRNVERIAIDLGRNAAAWRTNLDIGRLVRVDGYQALEGHQAGVDHKAAAAGRQSQVLGNGVARRLQCPGHGRRRVGRVESEVALARRVGIDGTPVQPERDTRTSGWETGVVKANGQSGRVVKTDRGAREAHGDAHLCGVVEPRECLRGNGATARCRHRDSGIGCGGTNLTA